MGTNSAIKVEKTKMKFSILLLFLTSTFAYRCTTMFCNKCTIVESSSHFRQLRHGCSMIMPCCRRRFSCSGGQVCGLFRSCKSDCSSAARFETIEDEEKFLTKLKSNWILKIVAKTQSFFSLQTFSERPGSDEIAVNMVSNRAPIPDMEEPESSGGFEGHAGTEVAEIDEVIGELKALTTHENSRRKSRKVAKDMFNKTNQDST